MKERIKKIFKNTSEKPDLIILKNSTEPYIDNNFFYVSGLKKGLFEESLAVLYPDGNLSLIVPKLEEESAKKAKAEINIYSKKKQLYDILSENIGISKKIGLNNNCLLYNDFLNLKKNISNTKFYDVSDSFFKSRAVKDKLEIQEIKKACNISDKVINHVCDFLSEGVYEYELAAEINYVMQKNGADKAAFETISSFGKNTAEPHYSHGKTRLVKGDFVLCDFGANINKYNSDMTRTIVYKKASEKQKQMYKTVLEAQRIGLKKIKTGIDAFVVHKAVYDFIQKTKFKDCFIHSTGHSLGLDVHDGYVGFSTESKIKLEENMVLTVEPGVYIPGFGGVRIEDDVLIKKDKIEVLTNTSKELIELK